MSVPIAGLAALTPSVSVPEYHSLWFDPDGAFFRTDLHGHSDELERLASEARSVLMKVTLRNFWAPISFRVDAAHCMHRGPCVTLQLRAQVKHRDTGEPAEINIAAGILASVARRPELLLKAIRAVIIERLCAHEVDEALHFEGTRVNDPHAHGRRF